MWHYLFSYRTTLNCSHLSINKKRVQTSFAIEQLPPIIFGVLGHGHQIYLELDGAASRVGCIFITVWRFYYIYTSKGAASLKSVLKIGPISTCTVSIQLQSSRKFFYGYILPVRDLWTARFLSLSFVFYDKNHHKFRHILLCGFRINR